MRSVLTHLVLAYLASPEAFHRVMEQQANPEGYKLEPGGKGQDKQG